MKYDPNWQSSALSRQAPLNHTWPWRAHYFIEVNAYLRMLPELRRIFGDRPNADSLSVPMSYDGYPPIKFKSGSGLVKPQWVEALNTLLSHHPKSSAFMFRNVHQPRAREPKELLTVLGGDFLNFTGHEMGYDDCAALYGVQRLRHIDVDLLPQDLLLSTIIEKGEMVDDGVRIKSILIPWFAVLHEIERNPDFLNHFSKNHRKFEEFIAGAYERAGYDVILTPQSADRGRDIIASMQGHGSVRIIDQAKAFSPTTKVGHTDVQAMLGVLSYDSNVSKAVITTTSTFASEVYTRDDYSRFIPYRLELRDRPKSIDWLKSL